LKTLPIVGQWVSASRWRIYLLSFLLMIAPIALLAYSIGHVLRAQSEWQARTESTQVARIAATLAEEHFEESITFLESIAARRTFNDAWKAGNLAIVSWHLRSAKSLRPDLSFVSVYGIDGRMRAIYPPQPDLVQQSFAYRDWYAGFRRRAAPYISEVYRSAVAPHQLVVAIAVPIVDGHGTITGILMGADALDTISQRLVDTRLENGWAVELVDQNGHMAARQNIDPHAAVVNLSQYEPVRRLRAGESGDGIFERDGTRMFTHYQPVGEFNWGVLVERPLSVQQQAIGLVQNRVSVLGVVFLLVGLALSTFLGSLYSQLESGNRFINLSLDMHCTIGPDGFFRSLNPSWEKQLGFTMAELLAKPRMAFIHPDDQARTAAEFERVREGQSAIAFENRYRCKNGHYKWLLWNAVCVPEKNIIYAVARDITERKRAQEDREEFTVSLEKANRELELRNREVERATNLKSKFLASMSHELRTPLNAIVGFSDLLSEETPGPLNPKQKRFVTHIKQGSAHLLQLINDILDLSKIEAGLLELHCEDFGVKDALPEVLSTIRPLAMAKNIQVEERWDCDPVVFADRIRFKQILYNLLSNAVKFTPKDGRITVECYSEGSMIGISVIDTGVGIRPEDHALVFEEFKQVEGNAASTAQGTGLGLAITKRLVEQQGGRISLKSELGTGSCFAFTLPGGSIAATAASENEETTAAPIVSSSQRKPLILVVDDEMPARELIASYLEDNFRTAMADSGADAVTKAKTLKPDAITLDVLMSGGDGFQALVALKAAPETENVPIIVVSIVDNKQVGFALGAVDYLIKPINKQVLVDSLRKQIPNPADDDSSILLVDDDSKTLELLEETLRSAGYETLSVQSGGRALEVLSSKLVGAVVLDLMMPGMDGFEVIRHIRKQSTLTSLPVFVMTAKSLTKHELSVLNAETQALIQKNGSWHQQLVAEIGQAIQSQAAPGQARAHAARQS
jgi:PAS domain S-box-containing protein